MAERVIPGGHATESQPMAAIRSRIRSILRDLEDLGYFTPVSLISAPYKQKQPLDPTADVTPDASAVDHTRARREQ